jgi:hypothetical protein
MLLLLLMLLATLLSAVMLLALVPTRTRRRLVWRLVGGWRSLAGVWARLSSVRIAKILVLLLMTAVAENAAEEASYKTACSCTGTV